MAGKWHTIPFDEAVQINPSVPLERGGIYPFVDMQAVQPSSRDVGPSEHRAFSGGGSRFRVGDTLMARITPCLENGKIARFYGPDGQSVGHGSTEFIVIRGKEGVTDNNFAYYLTRSEVVRGYAISQMTGSSGRQRVPVETLGHLQVAVLPLNEQRAIAHILGTLDDKIELNRRMNETLEAIARAIFKSWFVDATQDRLPKGWREGALGDVAENLRRGVQPNAIEPSTPYIGLEHMPRHCIALSEWGHAEELESNKFEFKRGEILFGKLRPYFHKVGIAPLDGVCSTDILVVMSKEPEWFGFVLGHVSSVDFVSYTDASSTGTKMPRTNWQDMARYEIALPPQALAADFTEKIRPLVERITRNIHESRTLVAIRDALLPKLLSGEICVEKVEEFVETQQNVRR